MNNKRIAIIGGGAAGMMSAVAIKESMPGAEVLLFEKNAYLGAKVIISGGGRCNVTTGIHDVKKLLLNYPRGAKFLMSAMYRFAPDKVMEWFEAHGVPLKTEADLRVFPISDNGKDVVGALENELKKSGVKIILNANVVDVGKLDSGAPFVVRTKDEQIHECDFVVITTGGNAYRQTGSTGDGYAFAKGLGHSITQLSPSLNSFIVEEKWINKLAGISFKKGGLTLHAFDADRNYKRVGPFLFTHHGVTGPAVFAVSSMACTEFYGKDKPMRLSINFFPDEKREQLEKRFLDLADQNGKKYLVNFLGLFIPKSLCEILVELIKVDSSFIVSQVNKELREAILDWMQNFSLTVIGRGAGDEFVTAGGVPLTEVNTNTMESKICPGLYFAGEILDIDGFTGGFNLQASWATGKLAGEAIAEHRSG